VTSGCYRRVQQSDYNIVIEAKIVTDVAKKQRSKEAKNDTEAVKQ
jgi:hypothetical protein